MAYGITYHLLQVSDQLAEEHVAVDKDCIVVDKAQIALNKDHTVVNYVN